MQTVKLYGIPNCNTVKKARDWLASNNIAYEFIDFKKQGVSAELLQHWLSQHPHEKLINRAGLTWRGLESSVKESITSENKDNSNAIALMRDKTSVIKRPILEKNGQILALGFSEADYQVLIKTPFN